MAYCGYLDPYSPRYINTQVDINYCPPDKRIIFTSDEFVLLSNNENYAGDVECGYISGNRMYPVNGEAFPCASGALSLSPVEYFEFFQVKSGYVEHPSFTSFEEYFVMSQEQIDFILTSMLVMTMCVAFCLGFSANESSAK